MGLDLGVAWNGHPYLNAIRGVGMNEKTGRDRPDNVVSAATPIALGITITKRESGRKLSSFRTAKRTDKENAVTSLERCTEKAGSRGYSDSISRKARS